MFWAIGYLEFFFFFRLITANLILRKSSLFCHQKVLTWTSRNFSRHNMPSTTNIGLPLRIFFPSFFFSFTNELSDCASPGYVSYRSSLCVCCSMALHTSKYCFWFGPHSWSSRKMPWSFPVLTFAGVGKDLEILHSSLLMVLISRQWIN